ncbi:M56 family metallopeptidase [Anaerocolumna xylanovorans]|uniref:Signal transducer regulating beta-lactamase production, contains metallopeptidase domain n=1 Tax=Anaerocolumna xylanovorans DSM 12503 TaxID=1121345 RepID=A0A1M7YDD6_9FIRM|nr:M56 family metallopeptidase [Anaerocolumna xylanovorans]SHO50652.1 Signal transducer regulating beta-lactamase production, contains metallopeptidase domain [Anaerocolumna xylanovorans DSM 12503]
MVKINLVTIFKEVVSLSIMGTLPAIGIFLFKGILKGRLSARLQYYIWFLLILRLVIPFTIESPFHLFTYEPISENVMIEDQLPDAPSDKTDVQKNSGNGTAHTFLVPSLDSNNGSPAFTLRHIASLWLAVMIGIYIYIILVNAMFALKLRQCIPCTQPKIDAAMNRCKNKLHITGKITVLSGSCVKSPMVWGIFHPKIIIPGKMIPCLSQEELNYILLHELAHIKRKDLSLRIITMVIQGIYWFNPVIWYSMHKMKEDCELSCDASVLGVLEEEEYRKYGLTILSIMKRMSDLRTVPGTVGFAVSQNKRRIIMITQYKKTSVKWAVITLLCLVLLTGCSSLSGSAAGTSQKNTAGTENSSKNSSQDSAAQPTPVVETEDESVTPAKESSSDTEAVSFQTYFDLLGSSKQDLTNSITEKPDSTDEGGLEFKEAGIRVWFNMDTGTVSQIFTQRNDLDFKGAKIGDKTENFESAFGKPVSDKNGDMHFKYENGYISVNYDTQTGITYAVYLLSEDF